MSRFSDIPPLTDEEEAAIQRGIASDPDTWELSEEDLKNARPFSEVFPELYAQIQANKAKKRA